MDTVDKPTKGSCQRTIDKVRDTYLPVQIPNMHRLVLAFMLVGLAAAPAGAQREHGGVGVGFGSCAEYAKYYRNDPSRVEAFFYSWAQGYISGLNTAAVSLGQKVMVLNPPGFGPDEQMAFIRRYCAHNPLKFYADAVLQVWDKLKTLDR